LKISGKLKHTFIRPIYKRPNLRSKSLNTQEWKTNTLIFESKGCYLPVVVELLFLVVLLQLEIFAAKFPLRLFLYCRFYKEEQSREEWLQ
jgi:hypothetical protein